MWHIVLRQTGHDAYPNGSRIVKNGADPERFAYWVVHNDEHNVTIPLYVYLPADTIHDTKVIFSIHGINRNAKKYRNIFVDHVQDKNVMIVAPQFDDEIFSSTLALKFGNMRKKFSTETLPPEFWTFNILDAIFSLINHEYPNVKSYSVFGHSAGAQFTHRMIMFTDHPAIDMAVAANPGWLTVLDPETKFPYGVQDMFDDKQIKHILKKKLIIMAGKEDTVIDEKVRAGSRANAQGANRLERARYAFAKAKAIAKELDTPFNWQLVEVTGLGHSSRIAAPEALKYLI